MFNYLHEVAKNLKNLKIAFDNGILNDSTKE